MQQGITGYACGRTSAHQDKGLRHLFLYHCGCKSTTHVTWPLEHLRVIFYLYLSAHMTRYAKLPKRTLARSRGRRWPPSL